MQLSKDLVQAFQLRHREKYGEDISYEIAEIQLHELADLIRKTSPKEDNKVNAQILHS